MAEIDIPSGLIPRRMKYRTITEADWVDNEHGVMTIPLHYDCPPTHVDITCFDDSKRVCLRVKGKAA